MIKRKLPTPEELRKAFRYEPETGKLFWRYRDDALKQWNARWANSEAFTSCDRDGYRIGALRGLMMRSHRVIFAMAHGHWPKGQIDHINGIKDDNRIENLRDVTHFQNGRNQAMSVRNTSGVVGVYLDKRNGSWTARIQHEGKFKHIGRFQNKEDAIVARKNAEKKYGYHENHGQKVV